MSYQGGKALCSQHIIDVLNRPEYDGMTYIEPFVGYAHILRRVKNKQHYIAYDGNPLVVSLLQNIQAGTPIPTVSKSEYLNLKHQSSNHSLERAVACFAYSYNGIPWSGYYPTSRDGKHNYLDQRLRYYRKLQSNEPFMKASIECMDYKHIKLPKEPCLIYCDPPYSNTKSYHGAPTFETDEFWNVVREWKDQGHIVFVSEYNAPDDFVCVASKEKQITLNHSTRRTAIEKLFALA